MTAPKRGVLLLHVLAWGVLLLWCSPLLTSSGRGLPSTDWEWFLSYYEVLRSTLLRYHEFPGQNPWMYLGSPLWANAQIGPINHFTLLVLPFGVTLGFKLGIVVNVLGSFEAARLLGRRLFGRPEAAIAAGLLYALNPAIASQWLLGHACFANYAFGPLLALACLRLGETPWAGVWAGLVAGVMMHYGIHYFFVYAMFAAGVLTLVVAVQRRAWRALAAFGALFLLSFLALTAVRFVPVLMVMRDYPRKLLVPYEVPWRELWRMFFVPELGPVEIALKASHEHIVYRLTRPELSAYLGVSTLAFAAIGLRRGVRGHHVAAAIAFALLLGNMRVWQPSRWLSLLPPFDSMWVVTRWRVVVLGCLAFSAAEGLDWLLSTLDERRPHLVPFVRWLAFAPALELVALLLGDFATHLAPYDEARLTRAQLGLPETAEALSLRRLRLGASDVVLYQNPFQANLAIVEGYDPLFGYLPAKSARLYVGHPDYRGEHTVDGERVEPRHWSPNRLVFEGLPPGHRLVVNRNPGRGWALSGEPLFADLRVFELDRPFEVTVPPSGRVDLRYSPPGLRAGLALSLGCGAALLGLAWARRRRGEGSVRASTSP